MPKPAAVPAPYELDSLTANMTAKVALSYTGQQVANGKCRCWRCGGSLTVARYEVFCDNGACPMGAASPLDVVVDRFGCNYAEAFVRLGDVVGGTAANSTLSMSGIDELATAWASLRNLVADAYEAELETPCANRAAGERALEKITGARGYAASGGVVMLREQLAAFLRAWGVLNECDCANVDCEWAVVVPFWQSMSRIVGFELIAGANRHTEWLGGDANRQLAFIGLRAAASSLHDLIVTPSLATMGALNEMHCRGLGKVAVTAIGAGVAAHTLRFGDVEWRTDGPGGMAPLSVASIADRVVIRDGADLQELGDWAYDAVMQSSDPTATFLSTTSQPDLAAYISGRAARENPELAAQLRVKAANAEGMSVGGIRMWCDEVGWWADDAGDKVQVTNFDLRAVANVRFNTCTATVVDVQRGAQQVRLLLDRKDFGIPSRFETALVKSCPFVPAVVEPALFKALLKNWSTMSADLEVGTGLDRLGFVNGTFHAPGWKVTADDVTPGPGWLEPSWGMSGKVEPITVAPQSNEYPGYDAINVISLLADTMAKAYAGYEVRPVELRASAQADELVRSMFSELGQTAPCIITGKENAASEFVGYPLWVSSRPTSKIRAACVVVGDCGLAIRDRASTAQFRAAITSLVAALLNGQVRSSEGGAASALRGAAMIRACTGWGWWRVHSDSTTPLFYDLLTQIPPDEVKNILLLDFQRQLVRIPKAAIHADVWPNLVRELSHAAGGVADATFLYVSDSKLSPLLTGFYGAPVKYGRL